MGHIALFPYLALDERADVNGWELVPCSLLEPEDATTPEVFDAAPKHLALYRLPPNDRPCGCYLRPPLKKAGDQILPDTRPLRLAVTAAVLQMNPAIDAQDNEIAHYCSTSDNSLLYVHPYSPDGFLGVAYGRMITTQQYGLRAGSDHARIEYPSELFIPCFGSRIDVEYARALHEALSRDDDQARRLGVSIDWLDVAWRNTHSLDERTRLVALRSAFESLLNVGDAVEEGCAAFSQVLRDNSAMRPRTWTTLKGKQKTESMTDLQWWFRCFAFLRNAIMHGAPVTDKAFVHEDGRRFLHAADEHFRRALRATIANAGFPELESALARPLGVETVGDRAALERDVTAWALSLLGRRRASQPADDAASDRGDRGTNSE